MTWTAADEDGTLARVLPTMAFALLAFGAATVLAGCQEITDGASASPALDLPFDGNPKRGATEIVEVGCGSCHTIPGVAGANGLVGPPLNKMGRRVFVAGLLPNTPDNMMRWLRNPQAIVPGNAMPNMHLQEQQIRDITAYLYTLR